MSAHLTKKSVPTNMIVIPQPINAQVSYNRSRPRGQLSSTPKKSSNSTEFKPIAALPPQDLEPPQCQYVISEENYNTIKGCFNDISQILKEALDNDIFTSVINQYPNLLQPFSDSPQEKIDENSQNP